MTDKSMDKTDIINLLEDAGWYQGRSIDIEYIISELSMEGYVINNQKIKDLLKEYWNINIEFKTPDGYLSNIRLNTEVAKDVDKISIDKISQAIHDNLLPVGTINEDSALLLLSDSGKFYMITDNDVFKIRDNFFDTLKAIIYQDNITRFHFNKK
jgi:hypothetical protein